MSTVGPTQPHERIELLDALRGVALLGIFVVNVGDYARTSGTAIDALMARAVRVLAEGSFYPLFSFLFGVGFALFLERARTRGAPELRLFLRRALGLAIFGVLQYVLLEPRSILLRYAVLSVPLLALRGSAQRMLLAFAAALLLATAMQGIALARLDAAGPRQPTPARPAVDDPSADPGAARPHERFAPVVAERARALVSYRPTALRRNTTLGPIFACFLLGVWAWRRGVLRGAPRRTWLERGALLGGVVGLLGNVVAFELDREHEATRRALLALCDPALALAYACAIALLYDTARGRALLAPFGPLGRLGLTNYLMQSVAMSLLFLDYGLGLQHRLGEATCVGIACGVTGVQIVASGRWLRSFRYGPAEWTWRRLTYGRW